MDEKDSISIENHYFPCIDLFKNSIDKTYIKFFVCEVYKKMSFKNRTVVVGSNGPISLSIPIQNGRDQKIPFKEVKVASNEDWQKVHWRTITSCYGKSPFWEYYADYFAPFYERKYSFLWDFNREIVEKIWKLIDKQKKLIIENQLDEGVELYGSRIMPKNYSEVSDPIVYNQLFEDRIGFQPNVSILDLLCMEGPNTVNVLRSKR